MPVWGATLYISVGAVEDNVAVLLPLAREYQIEDLTKRCEQFLLCREPSVRSLALAEEFSLETLEKQCISYVNRSQFLQSAKSYSVVGGVAQWSGRRSVAGGLSLIYA